MPCRLSNEAAGRHACNASLVQWLHQCLTNLSPCSRGSSFLIALSEQSHINAGLANGASVHSNGTSHAPAEVHAVPVLTRMAATSASRDLAQDHLRTFGGMTIRNY